MIYILMVVAGILVFLFLLIWLRKVQFDAVHQNFLDLVDRYGGRVIRNGFAIRPKYSGVFKEHRISISLSSEKKINSHHRRFYISIYLQIPSQINFTVMSNNWLSQEMTSLETNRFTKQIADKNYMIEVTNKKLFNKIDLLKLEDIVRKMHPFAYVLVSKRGLILERLSENLISDTEIERLDSLIVSMSKLPVVFQKGTT